MCVSPYPSSALSHRSICLRRMMQMAKHAAIYPDVGWKTEESVETMKGGFE